MRTPSLWLPALFLMTLSVVSAASSSRWTLDDAAASSFDQREKRTLSRTSLPNASSRPSDWIEEDISGPSSPARKWKGKGRATDGDLLFCHQQAEDMVQSAINLADVLFQEDQLRSMYVGDAAPELITVPKTATMTALMRLSSEVKAHLAGILTHLSASPSLSSQEVAKTAIAYFTTLLHEEEDSFTTLRQEETLVEVKAPPREVCRAMMDGVVQRDGYPAVGAFHSNAFFTQVKACDTKCPFYFSDRYVQFWTPEDHTLLLQLADAGCVASLEIRQPHFWLDTLRAFPTPDVVSLQLKDAHEVVALKVWASLLPFARTLYVKANRNSQCIEMPYRAGFRNGTVACMLLSRSFLGPRLPSAERDVFRPVDADFLAASQAMAEARGLRFVWWAFVVTSLGDMARADAMLAALGRESIRPIYIPDVVNRWGVEDGLIVRTNDVTNGTAQRERLALLASKVTEMPRIVYTAMSLDAALEQKIMSLHRMTGTAFKTILVVQWSSVNHHPIFQRLGEVVLDWLQVDVLAHTAFTYLSDKVNSTASWLCCVRPRFFRFSFWPESKQTDFLNLRHQVCGLKTI